MPTIYETPVKGIKIHDASDRTYWVRDNGNEMYIEGEYEGGDLYINGRQFYYDRAPKKGWVQIGEYGEEEIDWEFKDTELGWAEFADKVLYKG